MTMNGGQSTSAPSVFNEEATSSLTVQEEKIVFQHQLSLSVPEFPSRATASLIPGPKPHRYHSAASSFAKWVRKDVPDDDDDSEDDEDSKKKKKRRRKSRNKMTMSDENNEILLEKISPRRKLTQQFRQVAVDHPPDRNPIGYCISILAVCCAGTALVGVCMIIVLFLFVLVLPIVAITMGAKYLATASYHCPVEHIPLVLLVGGTLQMTQILMNLIQTLRTVKRKWIKMNKELDEGTLFIHDSSNGSGGIASTAEVYTNTDPARPFLIMDSVDKETCAELFLWTNLVLLGGNVIWLLYASAVVYRAFGGVTYKEHEDGHYCEPGLFRFVFWYVTGIYIAAGIFVAILLVFMCSGGILACMLCVWGKTFGKMREDV